MFGREGQSGCAEFSTHSDMAAILSSQTVPGFWCDLRSQHRNHAAPSGSVSCTSGCSAVLRQMYLYSQYLVKFYIPRESIKASDKTVVDCVEKDTHKHKHCSSVMFRVYSHHRLNSARLIVWNYIRVECLKRLLATPEGLLSASHCVCFGISVALRLWSNHLASATVEFIYISPSPLLHRSGLCYAGCCASSLWSVLLILPCPALYLLWHVQTHIHRWEINWKHLAETSGHKSPPKSCGRCQLRSSEVFYASMSTV